MPLASAMQFLKGVSSRYLFLEFPELRLDLGLNDFWQRGYGYRLVAPHGLFAVRAYIRNHRAAEDHSPVAPPEPRTSVRGSDAVRTETS
jgi:REP element-mobilizing transposase RayT